MTAMEFGMWADFEGKRLGDCGGRTGQFLVAFSGGGDHGVEMGKDGSGLEKAGRILAREGEKERRRCDRTVSSTSEKEERWLTAWRFSGLAVYSVVVGAGGGGGTRQISLGLESPSSSILYLKCTETF